MYLKSGFEKAAKLTRGKEMSTKRSDAQAEAQIWHRFATIPPAARRTPQRTHSDPFFTTTRTLSSESLLGKYSNIIKIDSKIVSKLIQNVFKNEPTMGAQI